MNLNEANKKLARLLHIRPWTRHSMVLTIAGFAYIGIGISYATSTLSAAQSAHLALAQNVMGMGWWGLVFMIAGVMAILSSVWPESSDVWGYMVLTGLSAGWSAFYGLGALYPSDASGSYGPGPVFVWALVAFLWWAISGLVDPKPTTVVVQVGPD